MSKEKSITNVETTEISEAARIARREYHKKWQKENRSKVVLYQNRYWEKKARAEAAENCVEAIG